MRTITSWIAALAALVLAALPTVTLAATSTTTLTSSLNPSTFGQSVTFTATVKGSAPTGTVTFKDGTTTLGTGTLSGSGNTRTTTFTTTSLSGGSHSITAAYGGNANNTASTSSVRTQTVNAVATTTAVASSLNPSTFGQSVTFTATVTGITPTGTVTFKDGATTLGTGTLAGTGNSRTATLATTALAVGARSITASYASDGNNANSTSSALAQTVNVAATSTAVASSANPSSVNQSVTFTATVTGVNPTGTVTFKDGAATLGTGTLSGTGNSRTATFATSALASGSHSITASYGGDASNATSTSAALAQTVNAAATTTALASSPNPSTPGQSVTLTATVTPSTATGTVTFKNGATTLGTATLASGVASYSTSFASAGSFSLTASYGGDANNAASTSPAVTQTVAAAGPDLAISNVSTGAITTNQNGTYTIPITYTVTNVGTVTAQNSWYDMAYLSVDGVLDNADQAHPSYMNLRGTPLAAGASYTITNTFTTSAVAPGSYTLFVKADGHNVNYTGGTNTDNGNLVETNEANNVTSTTVTLDRPDLAISNVSTGAITTNQNGTYTIPITYTVTNVGTVTAQNSWYDMAYLSVDGVLDNADQAHPSYMNLRGTPLAAGASYTITNTFTTSAVAPGSYTLFVKADGHNVNYTGGTNTDNGNLVETNEANNVTSTTVTLDRPDLAISNVSTGAITTNQNGTYTIPITYTVTNVGTVTAQNSWYDMAYLSVDGVLDNADQAHPSYMNLRGTPLAAGASYTITNTFTTSAVAPGSYTLFVKADGHNVNYTGGTNTDNGNLVETNEANNVTSTTVTLDRPDLAISNVSTGAITTNQNGTYTIPITYTVTNVGTVTAQNSWYDMAYLSVDGVLDNADQAHPSYMNLRGTPLAAGASYTITNTFTTSAVAPGSYTLFVKADGHNVNYTGGTNTDNGNLVETNEANNVTSTTVTLDRPDLAISNVSTGAITTNQNGTYTIPITYTVTNVGTVTAQNSWYDMAYLSVDGVLDNADQAHPSYMNLRGTPLAAGASYTITNTFTTSAVAPGSYTLFVKADGHNVNYTGGTNTDNGNLVETNEANNVTSVPVILKIRTTTALALSSSAITVGQSVTLTASVSPSTATGTITFKDGSTILGTAALSGGVATFSSNFNIAGLHSLTASYAGDTYHEVSASAASTLTAASTATSTALSATPNPIVAGQLVTLTAVITGVNPTGTVNFKDGTVSLGVYAVASSSATLTTNFATAGVRSITATYSGDANNQTSVSAAVVLNVGAVGSGTDPMTWAYAYDASGNVKIMTDPNSRITLKGYDLLARLTTLTQPPVGGSSPVITTAYDAQDNVTQVTDPRTLATTYTVDGLGNRKATGSPDSGSASATYDAAGNVLTRTDARGKTTGYTYDSINRLTQVTPATGVPIVYEYDGGPVPTPPPNSRGRLTKLTDESGSTSWTYDGLGRVLTKTQIVGFGPGAKTFTVAYAWGSSGAANGKLVAITYPSGSRVAIGYDAAGRALSAGVNPVTASGTGTDLATTLPVLSALAYNGANDVVGWTWGDGSAYARSFDTHGRLATYALAGTQRSVAYDNGYGIVGFTHSAGGTPQPALDHSYGYDALDRLTSASVAGTSHAWGYDTTGNRTSRTIAGAGYANTIAPTSNRLATVQSPGAGGTQTNTYVHDAAGNLTQDGANTFSYGDRGRMTGAATTAGSVTYLTNGLEQRVMKAGPTSLVATGGNYFVYDEQGKLLGQYDANLTPIHETVYLGDLPVAVMKQTGSGSSNTLQVKLHYVYADQINTPRVIARASDHAVVWRWDQAEAFGATPPDENPSALGAFRFDQRFPGQVFDAETGNHDNWHRSYRPATGRYDSYDPIGLAGGINPFGYVEGSPVTGSDPEGLMGRGGGSVGNPGSPTPRPVYFGGGHPDPGFCGSGWNQPFVPDSIFGVRLRDACRIHDECYARCGASKKQCDIDLGSNIRKACGVAGYASGRGSACGSIAVDYMTAVSVFGGPAYRAAQARCPCEKNE